MSNPFEDPWENIPGGGQEGEEFLTAAAILTKEFERRRTNEHYREIRAKRTAYRMADADDAPGKGQPEWMWLTDELALPDDDLLYSIENLLPEGGIGLFAARYKAGKTIVCNNLLKAWADGTPFLGGFGCNPPTGKPNVTLFNYEMSQGQIRRWLRKTGIENTDRVQVVHLRGCALPFSVPERRKEIIARLKDTGTGLWVLDPASRAMIGMGDPNNNVDVNMFTGYLTEIKEEAGIPNLVLSIHMGHNAERAMGATAWGAWPDANWMLTLDTNGTRHFYAYGRDVEVEKEPIIYNPADMSVTLTSFAPAPQTATRCATVDEALFKAVEENRGIGFGRLIEHAKAIAPGGTEDEEIKETLRPLVKEGRIIRISKGRKQEHYLPQQLETETGEN